MAEAFEVYLYNVPKVTPDGKGEVPIPPAKTASFPTLEAAQKHAAENKKTFERVVVIHRTEKDNKGEQKLVERYRDGTFEKAEQIVRR